VQELLEYNGEGTVNSAGGCQFSHHSLPRLVIGEGYAGFAGARATSEAAYEGVPPKWISFRSREFTFDLSIPKDNRHHLRAGFPRNHPRGASVHIALTRPQQFQDLCLGHTGFHLVQFGLPELVGLLFLAAVGLPSDLTLIENDRNVLIVGVVPRHHDTVGSEG